MKKADKIDALKRLRAFVKSNEFGNGKGCYDGLCYSIGRLCWNCVISDNQHDFLSSLIPKHNAYDYVWKRGAKSPRIKFINEQLKKLEKK